jgi:hypothetical protein
MCVFSAIESPPRCAPPNLLDRAAQGLEEYLEQI